MKYIIMAGGTYTWRDKPKQLIEINGEPIIARTIRLLKERHIEDISISSNNPVFENFGVPVLHHENSYEANDREHTKGFWVDAFYPTGDPACYLFGDVVYSHSAIKKIVNTETDSVEFFASAPPFSRYYPKEYAEPFAFKVANQLYFLQCIDKVKQYYEDGKFDRHPIAWELWQVIKKTPLNKIDYTNYTVINDYTCDIDWEDELKIFDGIDAVKE